MSQHNSAATFEDRLRTISTVVEEKSAAADNILLRKLYTDVEILRLDIEEHIKDTALAETYFEQLDKLATKLKLRPIERKKVWWRWIDTSFRFLGVTAGFVAVGVFGSLPMLLLRLVDKRLGLDPFSQLAEKLRRGIAWFLLDVAGVTVGVLEGPEGKESCFKESCVLLTFSHASNIDGHLVSSTCPIRHYALAKKELFIVPFFSWISLAFGGIPVDRNNRDRAVRALRRASDAAKDSKICVVVAPEGTRSTTGQLLSFKKGPFYMWEELKAPIVPVVFYGTYDLYPVGSWVNNMGKVYVRYLDPIMPHEAKSREEMLRLLRRRMLLALADCPTDIGKDLSWAEWVRCISASTAVLAFDTASIFYGKHLLLNVLGLSPKVAAASLAASVTVVTGFLYIYNVYIVTMDSSSNNNSSSSSRKEKGL